MDRPKATTVRIAFISFFLACVAMVIRTGLDSSKLHRFTIDQIGGIIGAYPPSPAAAHPDAQEECWRVYYDDVRRGTTAIRTGSPQDEDDPSQTRPPV